MYIYEQDTEDDISQVEHACSIKWKYLVVKT
jgi:hypothetical protein